MKRHNEDWGKLYDLGWRTAAKDDCHVSNPNELFPELERIRNLGYSAEIVLWSPLSAIESGYVIMAEGRYSDKFRDKETGKWKN